MSEVWAAAAVTIVGGVIAGNAAEKKDKADKKYNTQMTEMDYRKQAQQTGYEAAIQDFYTQRDRFNKQRGLDQFRNFSTVDQFAPGTQKYDGQLTMPTMPQYNDFNIEPMPSTSNSSGGKGGGSNIMSTLDPIGSKLLGGLF